jgi:hypothetical protein
MAGGLPGCCIKKLNQSLTKYHPEIPDIGGQETCFLPGKKKKPQRGRAGNLADGINFKG